jgi:hypothetical protein
MRPSIEHLQKQSRRMGQFATTGHPLVMFVRRTLFKYIPEALVVRMRSAPPQKILLDTAAIGAHPPSDQ